MALLTKGFCVTEFAEPPIGRLSRPTHTWPDFGLNGDSSDFAHYFPSRAAFWALSNRLRYS